jgi:hypothetical protein
VCVCVFYQEIKLKLIMLLRQRRISLYDFGHSFFNTKLFSAASPNQFFYNTKVDGEDNGD